MKYLHWRGIAELSFARAAASYAYFDPKRRLIRFDPYFVNHFTILVNCSPKVMLLAVDFDEYFVDVEGVTISTVLALQPSCVDGAEFDVPASIKGVEPKLCNCGSTTNFSYAYFDAKRRLIRFDPYFRFVGAPLQEGLQLLHNTLVGLNLREKVRIGCAGKVVSAFDIARMIAIGADWCNAARGFMFAPGCLQALSCHTGRCPTGVATQDPARQRALVVPDKSERVYQFHQQTLHALQELVQAAGLNHPGEMSASHIVRRHAQGGTKLLANLLPFVEPGALARGDLALPVFEAYWPMAQAHSFAPATASTKRVKAFAGAG